MERTILSLGNPELYKTNQEARIEELHQMKQMGGDLKDTLLASRVRHGVGRVVVAPQTGVKKRVTYRHLDTPVLSINPWLTFPEQEMVDILDDCMSFLGLLVRVEQCKRCITYYKDLERSDRSMELKGDMSEPTQCEYDHPDGILATLRTVDEGALVMEPH